MEDFLLEDPVADGLLFFYLYEKDAHKTQCSYGEEKHCGETIP